MINELRELGNKDFAEPMLTAINLWLEKGKSKLDPKEFRSLYIKKIGQDMNKGKKLSRPNGAMNKVTVMNVGLLHVDPYQTIKLGATPINNEEHSTPNEDFIGLSFY